MKSSQLEKIKKKGVKILDSSTTFIDNSVKIGAGTVIFPLTQIYGKTRIGKNCKITSSVLKDCVIGNNVTIGPFSHIRPGTVIEDDVEIGNFVEIVRSKVETGAKVKHFSYLGDATVGKKVNVGAGTITANFDGKNKWETQIGEETFVGVDTSIVAPVKIGKRVKTGAGAVILEDLPDDATAVGVPAKVIKVKGKRITS